MYQCCNIVRGDIIREFFFSNNKEGISTLIQSASHYGKCTAVRESTGNMWIRIHDTLEENGIDTILANPYKTKIIAEAKIKSDKLDARILADLLRADSSVRILCSNKRVLGKEKSCQT